MADAMHLERTIDRLLTGRVAPLGPNAVPSGIRKSPIAGAELGPTGFTSDEQGDLKRHGGVEKAVHQYCLDHYPLWRQDLGDLDIFDQPGAFGENLAVSGLSEDDVCVGDCWALGDAIVQVSQARQPCWRLNLRFEVRDMARRVQQTGRTGWYYRVLESGQVTEGAPLKLLHRPNPRWPVSRLVTVLYTQKQDWQSLEQMASLAELSQSWRDLAARRLDTGQIEDWRKRLGEES